MADIGFQPPVQDKDRIDFLEQTVNHLLNEINSMRTVIIQSPTTPNLNLPHPLFLVPPLKSILLN